MIKMSINKIEKYYKDTDFDSIVEEFSKEEYIRFFLLKTICKWPSFKRFNIYLKEKNIDTVSKVSKWVEVYFNNHRISNSDISSFVENLYNDESSSLNIESIIVQLSKLPHFDWGGLYQNALEWKIVKNIQKTSNYDEVRSLLEWELFASYFNYWMSTWFNYWSSVMVEHYFKIHSKVVPTIWLIKHVDFIFDDVPVDLKVTYLPQEYVDLKRKESGLAREFKTLKDFYLDKEEFDFSKENLSTLSHAISASKNLKDDVFEDIKEFRKNLTTNLIDNEDSLTELMNWLYENQWTRRYDNSFRLFLICVDDIDVVNAWQMKNNRWLQYKINDFLDKGIKLNNIIYNWEWRTMNTKATSLIIKRSSL